MRPISTSRGRAPGGHFGLPASRPGDPLLPERGMRRWRDKGAPHRKSDITWDPDAIYMRIDLTLTNSSKVWLQEHATFILPGKIPNSSHTCSSKLRPCEKGHRIYDLDTELAGSLGARPDPPASSLLLSGGPVRSRRSRGQSVMAEQRVARVAPSDRARFMDNS